jgi:type I restriction enzyme M protein
VPIRKSDLYSSIWASCDELRGGMDASQYKDYVLFMLFIKYITDKYGNSSDFAPPVVDPEGIELQGHDRSQGQETTSATRSTPRSFSR